MNAPFRNPVRLSVSIGERGISIAVLPDGGDADRAHRRTKPIGIGPIGRGKPWGGILPSKFDAFVRLIEEGLQGGRIRPDARGVVLTFDEVGRFDEVSASQASLPELCPSPFRLRYLRRSSGAGLIDVEVRHVETNAAGTIEGALVLFGRQEIQRVSQPLYSLISALRSEEIAAASERNLATRLQKYIDPGLAAEMARGEAVDLYQASTFGIDAIRSDDDLRLDPVLFASGALGESATPLLPDDLQQGFVTALDAAVGIPSFLRVGFTSGVVLTDTLGQCLAAIAKLRQGPLTDRLAYLNDPASSLGTVSRGKAPFVASGRYAPHVEGVGVWTPPAFDFLSRWQTEWLPVEFVVELMGSGSVVIPSREAAVFYESLIRAEREGERIVRLMDRDISLAEARKVWTQIEAQTPVKVEKNQGEEKDSQTAVPRITLLAKANFDTVAHLAGSAARLEPDGIPAPASFLTSSLKHHQDDGIDWLVDRWRSGAPGGLLADEMGLGKTLQILAFLAWARAWVEAEARNSGRPSHPILVVVPASLLDVWKQEAALHLHDEALGTPFEAVGAALRGWAETEGMGSRLEIFQKAAWTLTTYETMAENALLFGAVQWSVVVYDEIQKLKDPATFVRNAATALNAEFILGSTGTPIENRIEDLWSIADCIHPGRLGDLRTFSKTYGSLDLDQLRKLRDDLINPDRAIGANAAPFMLRRFKEDVLDALPAKLVAKHERIMPPEQAEAYASAIRKAKEALAVKEAGSALRLIQDIRAISLHPDGGGGVDVRSSESVEAWIARSARMSLTFDILDDIYARGDKVLVYVEDLALQVVIAETIRRRYGMDVVPDRIHGGVRPQKRAKIVNGFQERDPGFDALILSPRAAGVGLTLTAATHVLFTTRWWNPSLEAQCIDRTHRLGQYRDVTIHIPMAIHPDEALPSFDRLLDSLLDRKRSIQREVLIPPVTGSEAGDLLKAIGRPGLASAEAFATAA